MSARKDIYSVTEDTTVHEAARYLRERQLRAVGVKMNKPPSPSVATRETMRSPPDCQAINMPLGNPRPVTPASCGRNHLPDCKTSLNHRSIFRDSLFVITRNRRRLSPTQFLLTIRLALPDPFRVEKCQIRSNPFPS